MEEGKEGLVSVVHVVGARAPLYFLGRCVNTAKYPLMIPASLSPQGHGVEVRGRLIVPRKNKLKKTWGQENEETTTHVAALKCR